MRKNNGAKAIFNKNVPNRMQVVECINISKSTEKRIIMCYF